MPALIAILGSFRLLFLLFKDEATVSRGKSLHAKASVPEVWNAREETRANRWVKQISENKTTRTLSAGPPETNERVSTARGYESAHGPW